MSIPVLLASRSLGHGGGERQLAIAALQLDRKLFAPHVLSIEGGFWTGPLVEAGIPLRRLPVSSFANFQAAAEAWRLRRWMRDSGIRLVLTFDYTMNIFAIPVALTLPGVIALSSQRCELALILPRYQKATRWIHRLSSGVVVNSSHLTTELKQQWGIDGRRIHLCPNGLDLTRFHNHNRARPPELAGARLVVGTASVLRPEKNIDLLIEAFAAIASPADRLVIVGSGPEEERLRRLAASLGDRCLFVPSTPDVAPWLRAIDVFVLASRSEGLSNALMEAMACGCCVTASDIGGNRALIQPGVTGLLFDNHSSLSLAGQLRQAMADDASRQRMAGAAATQIQQNYSWTQSTHQLEQTFSALLK